MSISKIYNWFKLLFAYSISFFGINKYHPKSPSFISVEVADFCNLHCPECPVGTSKYPKNEKKKFDLELFKKLIDELKPTLQHVILYFQGEPFLNRQLSKFIRYAHESNIYTSTSTNGQFLTSKNVNDIVASGLDKLIVSIDGTTQETYQSYRIGGNLERALNGVKEVLHCRTVLKSPTPLVEIQFIVLKTNEHQLNEMRKLAKKLNVDLLTFKTAQLYDFENGNSLMPEQNKYSRYKKDSTGKFIIKGRQANRCWRLWNGAVVNVNGEVLPCCFDKNSEYSFGNIVDDSFSTCWKNKNASNFRGKILQNRKQFEMCRNCTNN